MYFVLKYCLALLLVLPGVRPFGYDCGQQVNGQRKSVLLRAWLPSWEEVGDNRGVAYSTVYSLPEPVRW